MHIPDGFLDPKISTGLMGAAAAVLGYCFMKMREAVTALRPAEALATAGKGMGNMMGGMRRALTGDGQRLLYKMGIMASLIFAAQLFDFPIGYGMPGHLFGGVLAAVILGPFAGAMVMAGVLVVQMAFFSDGGLIALGANIMNMAVIMTIGGYYLYSFLKKNLPEWAAILIAAWVSVVAAALACALELGFSGTNPFSATIPVIINTHMLVGLAEALISLGLVEAFRHVLKG